MRAMLVAAGLVLLVGCGGAPTDDQPSNAPSEIPAATVKAPAASPAPAPFLPAVFHALGNEPFWSADVKGERLTYSTPQDYEDGGDGIGPTIVIARKDEPAKVTLTGTLDGQQLVIVVTPGPCSDGMSDIEHKWNAGRTLGGYTVQGCAEPAKP